MDTLIMDDIVIEEVKNDAVMRIKTLMKSDLVKMILYGSYARGDYNTDSDVDIAIITKCNRMEGKKYAEVASSLSLSVKTVEAEMTKALRTLRNEIDNYILTK